MSKKNQEPDIISVFLIKIMTKWEGKESNLLLRIFSPPHPPCLLPSHKNSSPRNRPLCQPNVTSGVGFEPSAVTSPKKDFRSR